MYHFTKKTLDGIVIGDMYMKDGLQWEVIGINRHVKSPIILKRDSEVFEDLKIRLVPGVLKRSYKKLTNRNGANK